MDVTRMAPQSDHAFSLLMLAVAMTVGSSFPQGAPAEACESLLPRHWGTKPISPQASPYSFMASDNHYYYNMEGIQVELAGPRFKGFLVAALDPHSHERIGKWLKVKGTDTLPCSAISHSDPFPKKRLILLWQPPRDRPDGDVIFVATVLQSYGVYFSGLVASVPSQDYED